MNNLSYTNKFYILSLNDKGKIPVSISTNVHACLIAGGLMELMNAGIIAKDEKDRLTIQSELPDEFHHLLPLYERISTAKKPKTIEKFAADYLSGGKHLDHLLTNLKVTLVANNYKEHMDFSFSGLVSFRTVYVPKEDVIFSIIDPIRDQFLRGGVLTDEVICLTSLLDESKLLPEYFGNTEITKIRKTLAKMPASGTHALAKKIIDETITMLVVLTAIIT